ncbi:MAG: hypothetical protein NTX50_31755 [Candidatus Sumerlaeota bacterium]|nr:hypothetical protein [Candidatus Sumerlaeota bacterium]
MAATFAEIVEEVHELDQDSKHELLDMLHAWLVDERREEIRLNAQHSKEEYEQGRAKSGNLDDMMKDLYGEDE